MRPGGIKCQNKAEWVPRMLMYIAHVCFAWCFIFYAVLKVPGSAFKVQL